MSELTDALDGLATDQPASSDTADAAAIPAPPSLLQRVAEELRPASLLNSLIAALVYSTIAITVAIAYGALLFGGDLSAHVPAGIGLVLLAMALNGGLMALIAAAVGGAMPDPAARATYVTVAATFALGSALAGLAFLLLGWFRLGNLIRFIPYPVIGGFLAGSGLILADRSISLMSGVPLLASFGQPDVWVRWLPGLALAVIIKLVTLRVKHPLAMPVVLVAAGDRFYVAVWVAPMTVSQAMWLGWLVGQMPSGGLYDPVRPADLMLVDWPLVFDQLPALASAVVVSVVAVLLNATSIELAVEHDVDLNHELRAVGLANLFAGLGGGPVGFHVLGGTALVRRMGAATRLVGLLVAALCAVVMLVDVPFLAYLPKVVLGGLLLYLGLDMVWAWVYEAWFRLPRTDYGVVILILLVIYFVGFLEGVGLGIVLSAILFVVSYSRINVIKYELTGANHRSTVERPHLIRDLLRQKGHWLYVLKLQGFIFFGTANILLEQVRARIETEEQQKPRYLILDFHLVTGLDSSAMLGFQKMKQLAARHGIKLVLTDIRPAMLNQLDKPPFSAGRGDLWFVFGDLDHGMEWCENRLIDDLGSVGFKTRPPTVRQQFRRVLPRGTDLDHLMQYFEPQELKTGEHLLREGDPTMGMYFLEQGRLRVQLELPDNKALRLRIMNPGTVIGEVGTYLDRPATASVIAEEPSVLYHLTPKALNQMEKHDPAVAAAFHRFMAQIISERLSDTNNTLRITLD